MKVTGYKIREALKIWQTRRDTAEGQFKGTLIHFEGDEVKDPKEISNHIAEAEAALSRLQVLQVRYNLQVTTSVDGLDDITLLECIKRIGGLGRLEKMWRSASRKPEDRYGDPTVRTKDTVVAKRSISYDDAAKITTAYGKQAAALREAIAVGNATSVEFENLDAALFE